MNQLAPATHQPVVNNRLLEFPAPPTVAAEPAAVGSTPVPELVSQHSHLRMDPKVLQQIHAAKPEAPAIVDPLAELKAQLTPIAQKHDSVTQTDPQVAFLNEVKAAIVNQIGTHVEAKDSMQTDSLRQQLKATVNEANTIGALFSGKVIGLLAQAKGFSNVPSGAGYDRALADHAETVAKALVDMVGDINSQPSSFLMKLFTNKPKINESLATVALNGLIEMLTHSKTEVAQEAYRALRKVVGGERWYRPETNLFGMGAQAGLRQTAEAMIKAVKEARPELELSSAIGTLGTDSFNLQETLKIVSGNIGRGAKVNDLSVIQRGFQQHVWLRNDAAKAQERELVKETLSLLNGVAQANPTDLVLANEVKYTIPVVTKFGENLS